MIYQNMEFHNVIAMEPREGFSGLQLQRYPKEVRDCMSPRGRWNSQQTPGTEIRFVTDADHIRLFVSSLEGDAELLVFNGDILHSRDYLNPGQIKCIHVEKDLRYDAIRDEAFSGNRFSRKVWRFFFEGYQTMFHGVETYGHKVRPPSADEKPAKRWLAYGSSITAGCYPQLAARKLGVDVMNMALGGACMCEKETADFFASRGDWDFATYEIGVNMRDIYSPEIFRARAEYLVNTTLEKNPGKPLILITSYLNAEDFLKVETVSAQRQVAYNKILHDIVNQNKGKKLFLIDGRTILTDFSALTRDLIHPSEYGHILMAENIASAISAILGRQAK